MADQPTTPSGSRWEPRPDEAPDATSDETSDETPHAMPDEPQTDEHPAAAAYPSYGEPDAVPDATADERRAQLRRRGGLAGAAAAIALGAGLTGFVVGHSTAGDQRDGFTPAGFTGQPGGGRLPGDGQLGEGQQGPPAFGDRDGDHGWGHDGDGDQPGQQGPGSSGSSGSSGSPGSSSSNSSGTGTSANPT